MFSGVMKGNTKHGKGLGASWMDLGRAINIGAAVGGGGECAEPGNPDASAAASQPSPHTSHSPKAGLLMEGRSLRGRAGGATTPRCHLDSSANQIPSIGPTNQLSASADGPFESRAHGTPSDFYWP